MLAFAKRVGLGGNGYARILRRLCRGHRDWSLRRRHLEWIFPKTRVCCFHNDGCAKLKLAPAGSVDGALLTNSRRFAADRISVLLNNSKYNELYTLSQLKMKSYRALFAILLRYHRPNEFRRILAH